MTGQVSGVDVVVALYDETVYGADPSPAAGRKCYLSKLDVSAEQTLIQSPIITAGRGLPEPGRGNLAVAGSIETTIAPQTIGFWLKHLLGAPTTTGSDTPYTHVFRPKALPIGFVVEKDYTAKISSKVERFHGMRIASADLKLAQEGYATLSMALMGKNHTINAAVLDATLDDPGHVGWTGFRGVVKKDGTQIGGVTEMTIKVDNSMPGGPFCFPASGGTAGLRYANPEGRAVITGSIACVFEDYTLLDAAIAGTDVAFSVEYVFGTGAGTAGNEKLTITVDHAILARKSPPLDTESGLMLNLSFDGFAEGSTDKGLVCTLLNAVPGGSL